MLFRPGLAALSCAECCRHIYDLETGQAEEFWRGEERAKTPRVGPPPCQIGVKCPKISPQHESEFVLLPENVAMLGAYLAGRSGVPLDSPPDGLRRQAFAVLDSLFREYERRELAREITSQAPLVRLT